MFLGMFSRLMFATATHQGFFAKTYFYNSLKSMYIRLYNLFWYFVFIECFLVYWCVKGICYHDVTNNKLVKKTFKNIWIKLKLIFIKKEKFYIKKYFSEYLKCSEFKFLRISNINFYRTTPWSYWMNEPQCSSLCQCFVVYCNELLFC